MGAPQDDSHSTDDGAGDRPRISGHSDLNDAYAPTAISARGPDTMSGDLLEDQTVATSGHTVSLYYDGGAKRNMNIPPPGFTLAAGNASPTIEDEPSLVMAFSPPPPIARSRWKQTIGIVASFLALIIVGVALSLLWVQRGTPGENSGTIVSLADQLRLDPLIPPAPEAPRPEDTKPIVEEVAPIEEPVSAAKTKRRTRIQNRRVITDDDAEIDSAARPDPENKPENKPETKLEPKTPELEPEPEAQKEGGTATINVVVRKGGKPLPAEIVIDGVSAAQAPARLELSSGTHTIEIRTPGAPPQKRVITLSGGQSTRVLFDL